MTTYLNIAYPVKSGVIANRYIPQQILISLQTHKNRFLEVDKFYFRSRRSLVGVQTSPTKRNLSKYSSLTTPEQIFGKIFESKYKWN